MSSPDTRTPPFVLFATADASTAQFVEATLGQAGFAAESVSDRASFMKALERSPVLTIIDARIPSGFQWCGAAQHDASRAAHGPAAPIVMLCEPNEIARVREVGAVDFVLHPLSKDMLVHRVRHVLQLLRTERELEEHRHALAATQRLAGVGTWTISVATDVLTCSDEARRIFGWPDGASLVHKTADVLARVDENRTALVREWFEHARRGDECAPIEYRRRAACEDPGGDDDAAADTIVVEAQSDATKSFVRLHIDRVEQHGGHPSRVWGLVREISDPLDARTSEGPATNVDGLAGLPDERQFLERVARVLANAQPPHDHVAVLYMSLDVDEALRSQPSARGECLARLVQRIKACIRDRDTLCHLGNRERDRDISFARVGADEFSILLPGFLHAQDAYKVARRIQESLAQPMEVESSTVEVHSSFGISIYPTDSMGPETLLKAAEAAMRAARAPGKSIVHFFTAAMNVSAVERMTLETDLRSAIERNQLLVYYQPKIQIASGNIVGMEALLRWKHPELGMVSPAQFIPIAEETGLIVPIGEWVLREACAQNKRWQDQGLPPIRMAVNLSTVQFRDPDLHKTVTRVLRATGLSPTHLELELTESVLLQRADTTIATLQNLKRMGVHLSIDDFGTGYSSLSYLRRFPIDSLKIDQSFIREVTTNPEDVAITTSIILMGRSLKLKVVAEGVESPSQLALLRVLECDEAQGYLFSRPAPADEIVKLFRTNFAVAR